MFPGTMTVMSNSYRYAGYDGDHAGINTYIDPRMSRAQSEPLRKRDEPFMVIASLNPQEFGQEDVTYRPTLVLSTSGRLAWVVDFMLVPAWFEPVLP